MGIQNRRQIGICSKLQNNQNRLVSDFKIHILVTMTEADLRNALDMTVDKIMNKLARKPFLDAFPEDVDKSYLTSLHGRLQELIRPKLSQTIEEKLEEYNVVKKLTELDTLVTNTQHSRKHQAWRPASGADGVKMTMAAHDYRVACQEREDLETLLQQMENENEKLEEKISESTSQMKTNMEMIETRNVSLKTV